MYTDVHFSSGVQGQAKAKIVVPVVRVVVVPFTDDAVLRVIVPTTATYDEFSTGSSTLLMSLPFNISTTFNLQSNRNGIIVFVELLRKNPVWTLSDFVKIQKFSSRIVQECASLHILERRVCRANTLLHRSIAIRGDSAMYVLYIF